MKREPELALYRSCSVVSETSYTREGGRTLTQALVDAVAEAEGVAPTELPSLYGSLDLDALTALLTNSGEAGDDELLLALRMGRWNVFVSSDGRIRVCDATDETPSLEPIFDDGTS
nr:HalOD1 output domain-containing protein [Halapricum sp. CBA1109]